jgi:class 3 adenylate cyclase
MTLLDDLTTEVNAIVSGQWTRRDGTVIPEISDLKLTNDAVDLEATFLYADLADSTELVLHNKDIAAEVMKAYLKGTTRIIRSVGGEIRSFDGDRVMGVFIEGAKNTLAVDAALKINYFFSQILKPAFARVYTSTFPSVFDLKQTVGVDTSKVMIVRSGIRNNNDLVWVGRAPNIAAKLSAIREGYAIFITKKVFDSMLSTGKYGGDPKQLMWELRTWTKGNDYGVTDLYCSNWRRTP